MKYTSSVLFQLEVQMKHTWSILKVYFSVLIFCKGRRAYPMLNTQRNSTLYFNMFHHDIFW